MEMTLADKKKLVAELAPYFVEEFRKNSEMIIHGANKAVKMPVRIIDSGKISTATHMDLEKAEAAIDSATTLEEMRVAVKDMTTIFRTILIGRK